MPVYLTPQSSTKVSLTDLKRIVGHYLGYGHNPTAWSDSETYQVEQAVAAGIRQFYSPPAVQGVPPGFQWSWLWVFRSNTITPQDIDPVRNGWPLPEGSTYAEIRRVHASVPNGPARRLSLIPPDEFYTLRAQDPDLTADLPEYAVVQFISSSDEFTVPSEHRIEAEIWFYPRPAGPVQIQYIARLRPLLPSSDGLRVLCPSEFVETLYASCLAAAEALVHDQPGPQTQRFLSLLAGSITKDSPPPEIVEPRIWPSPTPTLELRYEDLLREAGIALGYGPNYWNYTTSQQALADELIHSALRRFYYATGPQGTTVEWSFLQRPERIELPADRGIQAFVQSIQIVSVSTTADGKVQLTVNLPLATPLYAFPYTPTQGQFVRLDDGAEYKIAQWLSNTDIVLDTTDTTPFTAGAPVHIIDAGIPWGVPMPDWAEAVVGDLYFVPQNVGWTVRHHSVTEILRRQTLLQTTGRPTIFAVSQYRRVWPPADGLALVFWPRPTTAYTLMGQFRTRSGRLTFGDVVPGGAAHTETMIAAIRLTALRYRPAQRGEPDWGAEYAERLLASIQRDQKHHDASLGVLRNRPETFGYDEVVSRPVFTVRVTGS